MLVLRSEFLEKWNFQIQTGTSTTGKSSTSRPQTNEAMSFDATIQMRKNGCRRQHRLVIQAEFLDKNLTKLILNGHQC
ncbi:hypothetical protein GCK32_020133, partial [Trichostrongylus colubriformis]